MQRNNEKLLHDMQGVADRRAHYYCVLVLVHHADDPQPLIAEGEWHGEIALQNRAATAASATTRCSGCRNSARPARNWSTSRSTRSVIEARR